jgi:hypothetical protein
MKSAKNNYCFEMAGKKPGDVLCNFVPLFLSSAILIWYNRITK